MLYILSTNYCTLYIHNTTSLYTSVLCLILQNGGQCCCLVFIITEVWLWNINKILTSLLFVPFVQNSNIRNDLILSVNYDFHFITFIKLQYLNLAIASYLRNIRSSRTIQTRLVLHHLDRLSLDWLNKILSPGFWNRLHHQL